MAIGKKREAAVKSIHNSQMLRRFMAYEDAPVQRSGRQRKKANAGRSVSFERIMWMIDKERCHHIKRGKSLQDVEDAEKILRWVGIASNDFLS